MRRLSSIVLGLAFPLLAAGQDSHQLSRLEQEVRQLQREVVTLSQLVNQLRMQADRSPSPVPTAPLPSPGARSSAPAPATASRARWIDAERWRSLQAGMSELEVIERLGAPTSMRRDGPRHILFYALEIGPSAFLAGSVTLQDQAVVSVETPTLK